MELSLPEGKYVVAVSGGVDSVVLLHALRSQSGVGLVVAHFDHGIRPDSAADRSFVQKMAKDHALPFFYEEGRLGPGASEAAARAARYDFLGRVRNETAARAVVTAHHRDDVLETAIINLLRGSGRKGLTALAARPGLERPLLDVPKSDVMDHARTHGLEWREDSTNRDTDYLRNYVRHRLLPRFGADGRARLWDIINDLRATNAELDSMLTDLLSDRQLSGRLDRDWFASLPHGVAKETMAAWLRGSGRRDFDGKALERLVVAAKTGRPGKVFDVSKGFGLKVTAHDLALTRSER